MWARLLLSSTVMVVLASNRSATEAAEPREFPSPYPPKFIIVLSRQRSSSSTLSLLLGQHPCSLQGNEIWFNSPQQDHLRAFQHTKMTTAEVRENPHAFLNAAHDKICDEAVKSGRIPDACGGKCTIVVKTFDVHQLSMEGIFSMMEDPALKFVVLERDVQGEYCSHAVAVATGDYAITPSGHKKESVEKVKCESPPQGYSAQHSYWFSTLREGLRARGVFFVDVPFALVASCGLQDAVVSILGFMGLYAPFESSSLTDGVDDLFKYCESSKSEGHG